MLIALSRALDRLRKALEYGIMAQILTAIQLQLQNPVQCRNCIAMDQTMVEI